MSAEVWKMGELITRVLSQLRRNLKSDLPKFRDIDVLMHMWDTVFRQTYCQCNESLIGSQFAHPNFQFEEVEMPFSAWPTEEMHWRFSKMSYVWRIYYIQLAQPFTSYHIARMAHGQHPSGC